MPLFVPYRHDHRERRNRLDWRRANSYPFARRSADAIDRSFVVTDLTVATNHIVFASRLEAAVFDELQAACAAIDESKCRARTSSRPAKREILNSRRIGLGRMQITYAGSHRACTCVEPRMARVHPRGEGKI